MTRHVPLPGLFMLILIPCKNVLDKKKEAAMATSLLHYREKLNYSRLHRFDDDSSNLIRIGSRVWTTIFQISFPASFYSS